MSFSIRNIFTPEDGGQDGVPAAGAADMRYQGGASTEESGGESAPKSQIFLVSELLPFIPPAIAAQSGIPMEKEVAIALPADGSNDVFLSALYQVCPELFAAEITPLNESTVTLPAKLSSAPEPAPVANSPFTPGAAFSKPPGMSATPPESSTKPAPPSKQDAGNPFWSPEADEEETNNQPQLSPLMSDPNSHQQPQSNVAKPDQAPGPGGFGNLPEKGASPNPLASGPAEQNGAASQPLAEDAILGGFSAPAPEAANPFSEASTDPAPEQASSTPEAFSGNPFESKEGYETLFASQAKEDSDIPFPSPTQAAPKQAAPKQDTPPEGIWGSMFDPGAPVGEADESSAALSGFGTMISGNLEKPSALPVEAKSAPGGAAVKEDEEEDFGALLPPLSEEHELPAAFQTDPASDGTSEAAPPHTEISDAVAASTPPASVGFSQVEPAAQTEFSPAQPEVAEFSPAQPEVAEFSPAQPEVAEFSPTQPEVAEASGFPADQPPASVSVRANGGAFSGTVVPRKSKKPVVSDDPQPRLVTPTPVPEKVEKTKPAVLDVSVQASSEPVAEGVVPGLSASGEIRDLELRAIFSTNDDFTLRSVARRIVALPGISSCALATPGRLVQASRNEESRIGDEAKGMVETIRNLAKLTGLPDAQTFTLHTDKGIVSLFLDEKCCLTVHHESTDFEPGTREKLIIISRTLENLEK